MMLASAIVREPEWNTLNEEQKDFCKKVISGKNVFLTGSAGTGKSFVTKFIIDFLLKHDVLVGKAATTGVAALQIGGSTIHSWAGLGLADGDINTIVRNVFRNKKAATRVRSASVLFLDEISMASGDLLNVIDKVFRAVRINKTLPFGGMQIILSGDVLQLPPVFKDTTKQNCFFFETESWRAAKFETCMLKKIVRQENDTEFAQLLERVRVGEITDEDVDVLNSRIWAELPESAKPVRIYGYNKVVDAYNQKIINSLSSESKTFYSMDIGEKHHIDFFNKNCLAAQKLELKVGAQVMLLYNINVNEGFVNGSIGEVTRFVGNFPEVKFDAGKIIVTPESWEIKEQIIVDGKMKYRTVASRNQIPLKVAYALTQFKVQGQTLNSAIIDLNQCFAAGAGYVSLSRVRSINDLSLLPFDPAKLRVDKKCLDFHKKIAQNS